MKPWSLVTAALSREHDETTSCHTIHCFSGFSFPAINSAHDTFECTSCPVPAAHLPYKTWLATTCCRPLACSIRAHPAPELPQPPEHLPITKPAAPPSDHGSFLAHVRGSRRWTTAYGCLFVFLAHCRIHKRKHTLSSVEEPNLIKMINKGSLT